MFDKLKEAKSQNGKSFYVPHCDSGLFIIEFVSHHLSGMD